MGNVIDFCWVRAINIIEMFGEKLESRYIKFQVVVEHKMYRLQLFGGFLRLYVDHFWNMKDDGYASRTRKRLYVARVIII